MSLILRSINSIEELIEGIGPWSALLDRGGCKDIYSHPLWHLAWWRSYGTKRRMEIQVAEENGNWVGVLPLVRWRSMRDGFMPVLEFSGGVQADRHEFIVAPGYEQPVLDLFEGPFEKLKKRARKIRLHNIPERSHLLEWQALKIHHPEVEQEVSPFLNLRKGISYAELEKEWSGSHRGDVRRQAKRLQGLGELTLRRVETEKEAVDLLGAFFATHTTKWAKKNLLTIIYNRTAKLFAQELIKILWMEGFIHFSTLDLSGKPISFHFGYIYKGRFYYYKPAYVLEYQNYSPGKVHIAKLLDEGVKQGWKTFDFLLGGEKYKYLWSKSEEKTFTMKLG